MREYTIQHDGRRLAIDDEGECVHLTDKSGEEHSYSFKEIETYNDAYSGPATTEICELIERGRVVTINTN